MPAISIVIGTYNYLSYLKLCLFAVERQTFSDFEVIIADDGSRALVKEWLDAYTPPFKITHLWHEDMGFRKCRLLNRAISISASDYLLFIDADCILSRDFIRQHWIHRKKGTFLGGRRVMMAREVAENIDREMIQREYLDGFTLWGLYHAARGRFRYFDETFRFLYWIKKNRPFSLLGCNFSIHKSDILRVNGFDEDYETRGGGEDTDISMRLRAVGLSMRSVRYRAVQFHLGHETGQSKSLSEKTFLEKKAKLKSIEDAVNIKSLLRDGERAEE